MQKRQEADEVEDNEQEDEELTYQAHDYGWYKSLSQKERMKKIKDAKQSQAHRKDNPQGDSKFEEEWWLDFKVYQGDKLIKLCTYRQYKQDFSDAKAVMIMFHGLNSHIGHGSHIAAALAEIGIISVGFDHRGFGKSEGKQGYVESLESHLYDSKVFVEKIKAIYPTLPMFVLGLSMGGMTSYFLSLRHKQYFKGVILMAPALKNIVGGMLVSMVVGLSSILPKSMRLIKPPKGQATKNPKITEDIVCDEFSFSDRASLTTLKTIIHTMDIAPETFKNYQAPFVVIQGALDKLVNPDVAFQLYDNCKSTDKQIWFYENLWHDIWHEEEIHDIIDRLKIWLKKRMKSV